MQAKNVKDLIFIACCASGFIELQASYSPVLKKDEKVLAKIDFISGNTFIEFYYGKDRIKG